MKQTLLKALYYSIGVLYIHAPIEYSVCPDLTLLTQANRVITEQQSERGTDIITGDNGAARTSSDRGFKSSRL